MINISYPMRTIITHFYNEEYLLPRWLMHHRRFFNHGILIDYHSTDRSVEICREICPTWTVITSRNQDFNAGACDVEVEHYEKQIPGWRIALTVTEFLVGNMSELMSENLPDPTSLQDTNCREYRIQLQGFYHWNPAGAIDPDKDLWDQFKHGVDCKRYPHHRKCRSLHNHRFIRYSVGRHYENANVDDVYIFKYSNVIANQEMLKRRLQIQHRVPESDRQQQRGWHHVAPNHNASAVSSMLDETGLHQQIMSDNSMVSDCSAFVDQVIAKMS